MLLKDPLLRMFLEVTTQLEPLKNVNYLKILGVKRTRRRLIADSST